MTSSLPEGQERRNRNRVAYELMKKTADCDAFFSAMHEHDPGVNGFSNFPRRILSSQGYAIGMFKDFMDVHLSNRQLAATILDAKAGVFLPDTATNAEDNIKGIRTKCDNHRTKLVPLLDEKLRNQHLSGWKTVEEASIAAIALPGAMSDMQVLLQGIQKELEMRELSEQFHQTQRPLAGSDFETEKHLAGNDELFKKWHEGNRALYQALYEVMRHLVLEKQFDFDDVW